MGNEANDKRLEPYKASISGTLSANNTTASITLFTFTGNIRVCIWGIVTTVLSSNVTAAHWRANDATNQVDITLNTGTTLSSAGVGSRIDKKGLAGAALVLNTAAQVRVSEHATSGMMPTTWFDLVAKNGATNTIEFRYSTTNTPATGAIKFFALWVPQSDDGSLS